MKKVILLSFIAVMTMGASAQFYTGLGVGYGLGVNKQVVGSELDNTTLSNSYGSYGQGVNVGLKFGYMFSENIGAELGASYLFGSALTRGKTSTLTMEGKTSNLRLAPQLVAKLNNGLYTRFGFIFPVVGKTVITVNNTDANGDGTGLIQDITIEAKGKFSLGYIAAVGYGLEIAESMDLFFELEYIGLEVRAKKSKITEMVIGGQDQLPNMNTSMIETEYVDELDMTDPGDANSPTKSLTTTSPFSSFGLNVGIVKRF